MVRLKPPGVLGPSELRQLLYDGRVDIGLRPVTSVSEADAAIYHVLPRLRGADNRCLAPAHYRSTAARCGLLGLIDRLLLLRCVEMLRRMRADGREALVVCDIKAASLDDPAFVSELDQQLSDDPGLATKVVLALDRIVRDRPSATAMANLRRRGVRFCLRRIGPPPPDPAELTEGGFEFVLLEATRFTVGALDSAIDPALVGLQRSLGAAGPTVLVGRRGFDDSTIEIPGEWALSTGDGGFDSARPSAA